MRMATLFKINLAEKNEGGWGFSDLVFFSQIGFPLWCSYSQAGCPPLVVRTNISLAYKILTS
jgi:hypothetical protein